MNRRSRLTMATGSLSLLFTLITLAGFALLAPQAAMAKSPAPAAFEAHALRSATVLSATMMSATVVVQFEDDSTHVRTIAFTEPITGLAALLGTGFDVTWASSSFGPAVCAIEKVGCPADDCFCDPDRYWAYSYWDGDAWQPYPVAAGQSVISQTGAVEGWRWGKAGEAQTDVRAALAAERALAWLAGQQDAATGGYGDGLASAVEVMLALGANDEEMADWERAVADPSLDDAVRKLAKDYADDGVAQAGKLAAATVAAEGCRSPRSLLPGDYFSKTLGAFSPDNGFNAWGILGSVAVSKTVPASALDALASGQLPSGGWEWQAGFGADTNTTALAIQALLAAGTPVSATEIVSGLAFLKSGQLADGGIVYDPAQPQFGADANSTAYTLQVLAALDIDPTDPAWTMEDGANPLAFLLGLQEADGSFAWQAGTGPNLLATAQAVSALLEHEVPIEVDRLPFCTKRTP